MIDLQLGETEIRVLGALMEKELTTPDYYPLSLNALKNSDYPCTQLGILTMKPLTSRIVS